MKIKKIDMPKKKITIQVHGVTDSEIKDITKLCGSLRNMLGAKTAYEVAELSDAMLEVFLSTTKQKDRREAIKKMWELEDWLSGKF